MGDSEHTRDFPRAIIHKKILDIAGRRPDASLETLAAEVTGASSELVEKVLAKYGDPAETPPATDGGGEHVPNQDGHGEEVQETAQDVQNQDGAEVAPVDQQDSYPDYEALTEKQRNVLHAIYEHPEAAQRELADRVECKQSTVSQRVNSIEGFKWEERLAFVETVLGDVDPTQESHEMTENAESDQSGHDLPKRIEEVARHLEDLEERVTNVETQSQPVFRDPELVHKLVHACMLADHITEEEELRILQTVLTDRIPDPTS